jgi:hypothetical protein
MSASTAVDPKTETPREKFLRLAEGRVTKALAAIGLVEQLANPSRYEYRESDIERIDNALSGSVAKAVEALKTGKPQVVAFSLTDDEGDEGAGDDE